MGLTEAISVESWPQWVGNWAGCEGVARKNKGNFFKWFCCEGKEGRADVSWLGDQWGFVIIILRQERVALVWKSR